MGDPKPFPQPYFADLSVEEAAEATRAPVDWEALMEEQTSPALALGAERRLNR